MDNFSRNRFHLPSREEFTTIRGSQTKSAQYKLSSKSENQEKYEHLENQARWNQNLPTASAALSANKQESWVPHYKRYGISTEADQPRPIVCGVPLFPVSDIDEKFHQLYNYKYFNAVQSACIDQAYYGEQNMVIAAPTASGKTIVLELTMLRHIKIFGNASKILYLAPIKALCEERHDDWSARFSKLGLKTIQCTGDMEPGDEKGIVNSNIIISTPEKWDALVRRLRESYNVVSNIGLVLIDEVHIIKEERGSVLESVISHLKMVQINNNSTIRMIALSATVPNIENIATWLALPHQNQAIFYHFAEEFRPVRLDAYVLGVKQTNSNIFMFDHSLNYRLQEIIMQFSQGRPTLIFCNTRKATVQSAQHLFNEMKKNRSCNLPTPSSARISTKDNLLRELISHGVAYHHAGLSHDDRRTVERGFQEGATSTLAMGINLPAHLVIVKCTQQYNGGSYVEYSMLDILQMIGRAGRPQFDESGVAVILTTETMRPKYECFLSGHDPLESSFANTMIEHLNAEFALQTLSTADEAWQWLQSTFYYIRALSNPVYYKLPPLKVENHLKEVCSKSIDTLISHGLLMKYQDKLYSSNFGKQMAKYGIKFATTQIIFSNILPSHSLKDLLGILSSAAEFEEFRFQPGDRLILNAINGGKENKLRYPLVGKIKTLPMKVNCMLQCALGRHTFKTYSLNQEMPRLLHTALRIAKFMKEFLRDQNGYTALLASIQLVKCIKMKCWDDSTFAISQLEKIGPAMCNTLASIGIDSLSKLAQTDARQIELILGKKPPFGTLLIEQIQRLPLLELRVEKTGQSSESQNFSITVTLANMKQAAISNSNGVSIQTTLLVGDGDRLIYACRLPLDSLKKQSFVYEICINNCTQSEYIKFAVVNEDIIGLDVFLLHKAEEKPPLALPDEITFSLGLEDMLLDNDVFGQDPILENSKMTEKQRKKGKKKAAEPIDKKVKRPCRHVCRQKKSCQHKCCNDGRSNEPQVENIPHNAETTREKKESKIFNKKEKPNQQWLFESNAPLLTIPVDKIYPQSIFNFE